MKPPDQAAAPKCHGIGRLAAISFTVVAACCGISVGLFVNAVKEENQSAHDLFVATTEDLASKLRQDFLAHMRDLRIISERVGLLIETSGAVPSRPVYARICEAMRATTGRIFSGLSFYVNISHAERPRAEAWLATENNVNVKPFYSPLTTTTVPTEPSPWYMVNLYTTIGNEEVAPFDPIRPGWTWSAQPGLRDLVVRSRARGRVLASGLLAGQGAIHENTQFLVFHSPIYATPGRYRELWWPGDENPLRVPYCKNDTMCKPKFDRWLAATEPTVALETQLTPVIVPVYNIGGGKVKRLEDVVRPICVPGANRSCNTSISEQMADIAAENVLKTTDRVYLGAISGSVYADRIAWSTIERYRLEGFVVACEDVTGVPGFEFALSPGATDEVVTSLPSSSFRATVRFSNGSQIVSGFRAPLSGTIAIESSSGYAVQLRESSYANLFAYEGSDFGGGAFMFAMDSRASDNSCVNRTQDGVLTRYCRPQMAPEEFRDVRLASRMGVSYVFALGDRIWHVRVATGKHYDIPRRTSTVVLAGGLVMSFLLGILAAVAGLVRTQQLRHMKVQAAKSAHELVISYAAHELRNPLHALSAATASLRSGLATLSDKLDSRGAAVAVGAAAEAVAGASASVEPPACARDVQALQEDSDILSGACEQLHRVVNDFSDLQRLRAGRLVLDYREVDVHATIREGVEALLGFARCRVVVHVHCSVPRRGIIDALRVQQIVSNAFTNACKNVRLDGCIRVTAWIDGAEALRPPSAPPGLDEGAWDELLDVRQLPASGWYHDVAPNQPDSRSKPRQKISTQNSGSRTHASDSAEYTHTAAARSASIPDAAIQQQPRLDAWLVIQVSDDGNGLSGRDGRELFEPFMQGDSTHRANDRSMTGRNRQQLRLCCGGGPGSRGTPPVESSPATPSPSPSPSLPGLDSGSRLRLTSMPRMLQVRTPTPASRSDTRQSVSDIVPTFPPVSYPLTASTVQVHVPHALSDTPAIHHQRSASVAGRRGQRVSVDDAPAAARRAIQGSGLGLSLTGCLVEMMRGQTALCEYRNRTRFVARIPVTFTPRSPAGLATSQHAEPTPHEHPPYLQGMSAAVQHSTGATSGACSTGSLPAATAPAAGSAESPRIQHGLRVLVVEDDPLNRRLVSRMLARLGHECVAVEDGDEVEPVLVQSGQLSAQSPSTIGMGGCRARPFGVILMDILMARTNGASVCKHLRGQGLQIPVVPMTANFLPSDVRVYVECGMSPCVLAKPFSVEQLVDTLQRALPEHGVGLDAV